MGERRDGRVLHAGAGEVAERDVGRPSAGPALAGDHLAEFGEALLSADTSPAAIAWCSSPSRRVCLRLSAT